MSMVSFTLNGKRVEVKAGTTILGAAQQNSVEIPTLCHDPRLKPTAACRLCIVDVEGARGPMPACVTSVAEGMVVKTQTDDLVKLRRLALELLLSDHYGDCVAPCQLACPAGIDIQGYIGLIANGQYHEALKLIKASNPLPMVVGRVCPRFCEKKCRRNLLEGPVSINALKRFVADCGLNGDDFCVPEVKPATGHRVAIIGGGPAGLSAAYYLALEGHEVTIFEASPKLGGMLRYGIPEYRLPKAILDKEIAIIANLCHEIRCNTLLGHDFTLETLKHDRYEAIFVALGSQAGQKMGVKGEDLPGVLSGIEFLRNVALGQKVELGRKVVVIGGGNTAIDAARTALRLGASEVTIVYRRSRDEMPANDEEIEQAEQEGIKFHFLAAPTELKTRDDKVDSIECVKMALGEPDSSGRRRPEPIAGSEFAIKVDTVIAAIGQALDATSLKQDGELKLNSRRNVSINEKTMETSLPGVFAGGDCTSGPATAIEAIAAGRRAAISMNQYLNGQQITPVAKAYNCTKGELDEIDPKDYENETSRPRTKIPALDPEVRRGNFAEIELGFTEEMAKNEAGRCLACGCQDVFECRLRELATEYKIEDTKYAGRKHHLRVKKDEHPYILRESNKCILCGRCVRICDEVMGIGALGFTNRGFDTVVEPALGMPLRETTCVSCGQCISTCPTGALTPKIQLPKPGPWKLEVVPTVCPNCGIGCNLDLNIIGEDIVKVTSPINSPVNNGNLCNRGAFNSCAINNLRRLKTPLVNRNGRLVEASWKEAIGLVSEGLKQIREQSGGDSLAVLSSSKLTNEENYLVQKLARAALGTNNIGCPTPLVNDGLMKSFGQNASTCSYNDIITSDLIVVFDCDVAEDYPIVALKVREAVARGSKLIAFNHRATSMDSMAKIAFRANQRTSVDLLEAMLGYIISYDLIDHDFVNSRTTGFQNLAREMRRHSLEGIFDTPWVKPSRVIEAIHLYIRARKPVIIVNANTITPVELALISNLALITGSVGRDGAGIIVLRTPGNAQGTIDMGVHPEYLPGQQSINDVAARRKFEANWGRPVPTGKGRDYLGVIQGLETGEIKGLLVIGSEATGEIENALFEMPIFSVLVGTVFPEKPPYPSVILPGASFAESEGSYTNCERRIQHLQRALTPPAGKQNWEIISAIAAALGYPMDYPAVSSIYEEIDKLVTPYRGASGNAATGRQWPFLRNGRFNLKDGLARLQLTEVEGHETIKTSTSLS